MQLRHWPVREEIISDIDFFQSSRSSSEKYDPIWV